jgi:hypothetical protein
MPCCNFFRISHGMEMMNTTAESTLPLSMNPESSPSLETASLTALARFVPAETSRQIFRMFRDPRVFDKEERSNLVCELRKAVETAPNVPEVRVLFGMALCVDLQAQEAMEQLRMAVEQAPNCFIARLKYGELLMRLRICRRAAEETRHAALLAGNAAQSELARRQAATIRTMLREGIERGGYKGLLPRLWPRRKTNNQNPAPVFLGTK